MNNGKWFLTHPTKQTQEVIFSRKSQSLKHLDLYFDSLVDEKVKTQKRLELKIDDRLIFGKI